MTTSAHGLQARQRAPRSPSPRTRGEGRDEGRRHTPTLQQAPAPHPNPLPAKGGERGKFASPDHVVPLEAVKLEESPRLVDRDGKAMIP